MSETTTQPSAAVATETAAPPPEVRIDFNDGNVPSSAELAGDTAEPSSTPEPSEPAPTKTVPLAALHEERERRKELAEQVKREAAERQKLESRFEELKQRLAAPPPPPAPEIPALDVDPVANFDARLRQQEMARQQFEAERQQQSQVASFHAAVAQAEAAYRAQATDYDAAVAHLQRTFETEAQFMGISPGDIARSVAVTALQNGRNPAEVAYNLAKSRGYTGAKPAATAADGMAAIERGQAATGSAANAPAAAEANLTANRLANMSLKDFAQVSDADFRKLMGG